MRQILIIDDKVHILQLLELKLQQEGLTVLTARSGPEGLRLAAQCAPDLIVVDALIADSQEEDFVQQLSQAGAAATPVILLSARDDEELLAEETSSIVAQVRKPFRPSQLIALVRERL